MRLGKVEKVMSKKLGQILLLVLCLMVAKHAGIWIARVNTEQKLAELEKVQIVVFGDSIWDYWRGTEGIDGVEEGIDYRLSKRVPSDIYNLCIGGSSAGLLTEGKDKEIWNAQSLNAMVDMVTGQTEISLPEEKKASEVILQPDYTKTDYFIIAYGLNDYFSGVEIESEETEDLYTYKGAVRRAVGTLREYYPEAKIVLIAPNYCEFYSEGLNCRTKDCGAGLGIDYVQAMEELSMELDTLFLNCYETLDISFYNDTIYLRDGVHLTEKGRIRYAEELAKILIGDLL